MCRILTPKNGIHATVGQKETHYGVKSCNSVSTCYCVSSCHIIILYYDVNSCCWAPRLLVVYQFNSFLIPVLPTKSTLKMFWQTLNGKRRGRNGKNLIYVKVKKQSSSISKVINQGKGEGQ